MEFALSEEQRLFADSLRGLLADRVTDRCAAPPCRNRQRLRCGTCGTKPGRTWPARPAGAGTLRRRRARRAGCGGGGGSSRRCRGVRAVRRQRRDGDARLRAWRDRRNCRTNGCRASPPARCASVSARAAGTDEIVCRAASKRDRRRRADASAGVSAGRQRRRRCRRCRRRIAAHASQHRPHAAGDRRHIRQRARGHAGRGERTARGVHSACWMPGASCWRPTRLAPRSTCSTRRSPS